MYSYQVDDTLGGGLVTEEKETLASVRGPGGVVVSSLGRLLGLQVRRQVLGLDGVRSEPEELLGVDEVPRRHV